MATRILVAACMTIIVLTAPAGAQQYPPGDDIGCTVATSSTAVGETFSFNCRGYLGQVDVVATLFSEPIVLGTKTSDADGVVDFDFVVPAVTPGAHRVEVTGPAADGTLTQSIAITVAADGGMTAVTAPDSYDSSGDLARTGSDLQIVMARVAIVVLAVGGVLLVTARKRRVHAEKVSR